MEKNNNVFPKSRLLVFAAISVCFGIAVFVISDIATEGGMTVWCAVVALLAGALLFCLTAVTIFYSLYKRYISSPEAPEGQTSCDMENKTFDRSFLDPYLEGEIAAAKKENRPVSIIMADLDHFREINSTYGRIVGDHILTIFAQVILKSVRQTDIIARYGGDEFIIVMPDTDTETARAIAEKMREDVAGTYIPPIDDVVVSSIHCSVGVSAYPELSDDKASLIKASDMALYMAKRSGRNCTKVYQSEAAVN